MNSKFFVVVFGDTCLVLDVDTLLEAASETAHEWDMHDPESLVRRISLPVRCTSMDILGDAMVICGNTDAVYTINMDGRIISTIRLPDTSQVTSVKVIDPNTILIGTTAPELVLMCIQTGEIKSTHSIVPHYSISFITVDRRSNWFSAVATCPKASSMIYVGSTRNLSSVFESTPSDVFLSRVEFVELSSNGLSLLCSGPTPQVTLVPLDLTTAIPRMQFDPATELSAVFASARSPRGDIVAFGGVGHSVLLVSAYSLNIVEHLK
jgi:hypothetical protein